MVDVAVTTPREREWMNQRWLLFAGLVVLNVIDVVTTAIILRLGGVEGNPFVRPMIDGIWQVSLLKAAVLLIIAMLLTRTRESRIADVALAATSGWYLAVVAWNLLILAIV